MVRRSVNNNGDKYDPDIVTCQALSTTGKYWRVPFNVTTEYIPNHDLDERRITFIRRKKWKHIRKAYPIWGSLEVLYCILISFSVVVGAYYFVLCMTLMGWSQSIHAISPNYTRPGFRHRYTMVEHEGYDIKFGTMFYFADAIWLLSTNIAGFYFGGMKGLKEWYYFVIISNGGSWLAEAITVTASSILLPSQCDSSIFKANFTRLFKWYGIYILHENNLGHEATEKIDSVQAALGCCGIDGWHDYIHLFLQKPVGQPTPKLPSTTGNLEWTVEHLKKWWPPQDEIHLGKFVESHDAYYENGRDLQEIPHSCCKPVWAQNIFCARNLKQLDEIHPYLKVGDRRGAKYGCIRLVEEHCEKLIKIISQSTIIILMVRLILIASYAVISYHIRKKYKKTICRYLFMLSEGEVGRAYLPFVKGPEDINLSLLRHQGDRFDPEIFKWIPPECTRHIIPEEVEEQTMDESILYTYEQGLLEDLKEKAVYAPGDVEKEEILLEISESIAKRRRMRLIQLDEFQEKLTDQAAEERNLYDEFDLQEVDPVKIDLSAREKAMLFEQRDLIQRMAHEQKLKEESIKQMRLLNIEEEEKKDEPEAEPEVGHYSSRPYIHDRSDKSFKRRLLVASKLGVKYNPFTDELISLRNEKKRIEKKHEDNPDYQDGDSGSTISDNPLEDYKYELRDIKVIKTKKTQDPTDVVPKKKKKKKRNIYRGAPRVAYMTKYFENKQIRNSIDEKNHKAEVKKFLKMLQETEKFETRAELETGVDQPQIRGKRPSDGNTDQIESHRHDRQNSDIKKYYSRRKVHHRP